VKHFGYLRRRDGIPDAEPRKTVNLRESTEYNDVSPVTNKSKCVRGIIEEFEIRLVEDDNDAVGHSRHETVDCVLRDQCAGGIVWVWNENDPGFCGDRVQCCREVLLIIRTGRFNRAHAESSRK